MILTFHIVDPSALAALSSSMGPTPTFVVRLASAAPPQSEPVTTTVARS